MKNIEYSNDWFAFFTSWSFGLTFDICGYFDNRPRIKISLIYFTFIFILPFRNKWTDECMPPKWGFDIHDNSIFLHKGGKGNLNGGNNTSSWDIPFLTLNWIRTSLLLKDGSWEHESKGNYKSFYEDEWKEKRKEWKYNYTDSYDGEIIPTTIHIKQMEWRPKWLGWTKLFNKTKTYIEVEFSKECGRRKGSWKGGTIGCSYDLKENETPLECIKRMEKERSF